MHRTSLNLRALTDRSLSISLAILFSLSFLSVRAQADPLVTDVRIGLLAHGVPILGPHLETGVDVNGDLLLASPVTTDMISEVAPAYRWLLRPAPNVGVDANTAGDTSQLYFGLVWSTDIDTNWWPADAVFFRIGFGGAYNTGRLSSPDRRHLELGAHLLFHPSLELGYRLTPQWSVSLYYEHSSNGGLDPNNDGLNNIGFRAGYHF